MSYINTSVVIPSILVDTFFLLSLVAIRIFYKGLNFGKLVIYILLGWFIVQGVLSYNDFYLTTDSFPPRFLLLMLPPLIMTIFIFFTKKGRSILDNINVEYLTYIHTIRIIVEIVFYELFLNHLMPREMTFEGRNFDIIIGITAPLVAFFGIRKKMLSPKLIIAWNVIGLLFLFNAVAHGILSAPTPFQKISMDQPNLAVFHYPFTYIVCLIVPIVYFSHFAVIRKLRKSIKSHPSQ